MNCLRFFDFNLLAGITWTLIIWMLLALALWRAAISRSAQKKYCRGHKTNREHHNNIKLTALSDGTSSSKIPVLPEHVVGSTTRIVSQPHAEVLDGSWFLLIDLHLQLIFMSISQVDGVVMFLKCYEFRTAITCWHAKISPWDFLTLRKKEA